MRYAAPATIQVGPWTVRVVIDKAAHDASQASARQSLFGHYEPEQLLITVMPGLAPDQEVDTILHETLHALTDAAGLTADGGILESTDDAERVVAPLATALLDLLRRNPDLVTYLTENP